MSDQDTPPPFDENSQAQDAPPPIQPSAAAASFSTAPPPIGNVALGQGKLQESDEKTMAMLAHLLGAFTSFIGPLIIWLIKKDESPFVNDQGKEALNFQISVAIGLVAAGLLNIPLAIIPFIGPCIGGLLWLAVGVAGLIYAILGCIEANKGVVYRYPFALRLIS